MKMKGNIEIQPKEWLYIAALIIIIALIVRGDLQTAINAITTWLKAIKT